MKKILILTVLSFVCLAATAQIDITKRKVTLDSIAARNDSIYVLDPMSVADTAHFHTPIYVNGSKVSKGVDVPGNNNELLISTGTGDIKTNSNLTYDDSLVVIGKIITDTSKADYLMLNPFVTPSNDDYALYADTANNTLSFKTGLGSTAQINRESLVKVYNGTGIAIEDGHIIGTVGLHDDVLSVSNAVNTNRYDALLWATTEIPIDGYGDAILLYGTINNVSNAYLASIGQVWLSGTPGEATNTRPVFPAYEYSLGAATKLGAGDGKFEANLAGISPYNTMRNLINGSFRESIDFRITSNGSLISYSLERTGGGDLTMMLSDGQSDLDCTPALTGTLTGGTDEVEQANYIYLDKATKNIVVSTAGFPATSEHIKVSDCGLLNASLTQTYGAMWNRNHNDHIQDVYGMGHIIHMAEKLRSGNADWKSGTEGQMVIVGGTEVYLTVSAGIVEQLHKQDYTAKNTQTGDFVFIMNDFTNPRNPLSDIGGLIIDANGVSLTNRSYKIVVWGVQNKTGEIDQLMLNLPLGSYSYSAPENAEDDLTQTAVYTIPNDYKGKGFLIAAFTVKQSNSNVWELYSTTPLTGQYPSTSPVSGGGGTGATTFDGLTDTPTGKIGEGSKLVSVSISETALEYTNGLTYKTADSTLSVGNRIGIGTTTPLSAVHTELNGGIVDGVDKISYLISDTIDLTEDVSVSNTAVYGFRDKSVLTNTNTYLSNKLNYYPMSVLADNYTDVSYFMGLNLLPANYANINVGVGSTSKFSNITNSGSITIGTSIKGHSVSVLTNNGAGGTFNAPLMYGLGVLGVVSKGTSGITNIPEYAGINVENRQDDDITNNITDVKGIHIWGNLRGTSTHYGIYEDFGDNYFKNSLTTEENIISDSSITNTLIVNDSIGIGTSTPLSAVHINKGTGTLANGIILGDGGDDGIYPSTINTLTIAIDGVDKYTFSASGMGAYSSTGSNLSPFSASATFPTVQPNRGNAGTGLGWNGHDQLSFVAGTKEIARASENVTEQLILNPQGDLTGTSAAPNLAFTNSDLTTDVGYYLISDNNLGLTVNSTITMRNTEDTTYVHNYLKATGGTNISVTIGGNDNEILLSDGAGGTKTNSLFNFIGETGGGSAYTTTLNLHDSEIFVNAYKSGFTEYSTLQLSNTSVNGSTTRTTYYSDADNASTITNTIVEGGIHEIVQDVNGLTLVNYDATTWIDDSYVTKGFADTTYLGSSSNIFWDGDSLKINGDVKITGTVSGNSVEFTAGDATPDVSGGNTVIFTDGGTSQTITNLDNSEIGTLYTIIVRADIYNLTIVDGGNFNLAGDWTGNIDDNIVLRKMAENDFIEISRKDN